MPTIRSSADLRNSYNDILPSAISMANLSSSRKTEKVISRS